MQNSNAEIVGQNFIAVEGVLQMLINKILVCPQIDGKDISPLLVLPLNILYQNHSQLSVSSHKDHHLNQY